MKLQVKQIIFDQIPVSDSTWAIASGADGCIYAGVCSEHTGGVGAHIAKYDPNTDSLDYILDVATAVGEPPDNGRATQCKVHSALIGGESGLLYGATHLSGPPLGEIHYSPWGCWNDRKRAFRGSFLFIWDTSRNELLRTELLYPREGCRAMALDESRQRLYGVTYPRDHFFVYDLERQELRDLGRIGSINAQVVFLDRKGNAYTTADYGEIIQYNIEKEELVELPLRIPHAPYQNGFHNVAYDVVEHPDSRSLIGVSWNVDPYLFIFDPEQMKLYDLGPAYPKEHTHDEIDYIAFNYSHAGGLVLGLDEKLYYCVLQGFDQPSYLFRVDLDRFEKECIGRLWAGQEPVKYIAHAVRDSFGTFYFAQLAVPTRIGIFRPDYPDSTSTRTVNPIRRWG